jgi:hypothetical protein
LIIEAKGRSKSQSPGKSATFNIVAPFFPKAGLYNKVISFVTPDSLEDSDLKNSSPTNLLHILDLPAPGPPKTIIFIILFSF